MTVKELIEELKKFDEDLEVGGSDHFGGKTDFYGISLAHDWDNGKKPYVSIYIQDAGEEPY